MKSSPVIGVLAAALACAAPERSPAGPAAADPADVASIDAIVDALYDVVSGEAGEARDWDRMRSLFSPVGARLIPVGPDGRGGHAALFATVDGYIERTAPLFAEQDFHEMEVARRVDRFGQIAHVFSTYESSHEPDGEPFARGVNSIQLVHDGRRWYVVTVLWDAARGDAPPGAREGGDGSLGR